ncbi:unnamed protein product [Aphanomyces euteiches]
MSVYLQMSHYMIVTADPNSYNNTLRDCENRSDYCITRLKATLSTTIGGTLSLSVPANLPALEMANLRRFIILRLASRCFFLC